MAAEEIERLKEKIAKDPNSKLFVPLAEEYKKSGMINEAIDVLAQGLERQPGYLSARVSLGKIYMEKGMPDEAKTEFEKVIAAIPDNLYAHKKLAEIYRDLGQEDKSIREFRTVLALNPMDESASASLSDLMGKSEGPPSEPFSEPAKTSFETTSHSLENSFWEEAPIEVPGIEAEEEIPEALPEASAESPEKAGIYPPSDITKEEFEIWTSSGQSVAEDIPAEEPPAVSISEEDLELWKSHSKSVQEEESISEDTLEIPEEIPSSFESIEAESVQHNEKIPSLNEVPPQSEGIEDADRHILQGEYARAMNVYRQMLSLDPGNRQVVQRAEELKTLLKLLGKDKEGLIEKLDEFLEALKKRRNELFGSP
jgi:tetratricopeptide (TPR) repeat protein